MARLTQATIDAILDRDLPGFEIVEPIATPDASIADVDLDVDVLALAESEGGRKHPAKEVTGSQVRSASNRSTQSRIVIVQPKQSNGHAGHTQRVMVGKDGAIAIQG
jgi:hypothetical protein